MASPVPFVDISGTTCGVCVKNGLPTAITSISSLESDGDAVSECADVSGALGSESWLSFGILGSRPNMTKNGEYSVDACGVAL